MIGNHKDTNKYPINLLIINYLNNLFHHHYNSFLSIFKQLLRLFGGKDKVFFKNASAFYKKKEAAASFFLSYEVRKTYFTMNFMVFSKPLALTVTK